MTIQLLRALAEQQRIQDLLTAATDLWKHTQDPAILPFQAMGYLEVGKRSLALLSLTSALENSRQYDADSLADLAVVLMLARQFDKAKDLLDKALLLQPDHSYALAKLGQYYGSKNELVNAQQAYKKSAAADSPYIPVFALLAQLDIDRKDLVAAQAALGEGFAQLASLPKPLKDQFESAYSKQLYTTQLHLWVEQQQFAEAEDCLSQQYDRQVEGGLDEADFIERLTEYGQLLAAKDNHQQALDILRHYQREYPNNIALCMRLAELAQVQGLFTPALNLLNRVADLEPDNIAGWVALSNLCLHRFDQRARTAAETALKLASALQEADELTSEMIHSELIRAKCAMAQVESHEQNFELAETLFNEILKEHPLFVPALRGLGQQQMQRGDIDKAIALFETIKKVDPVIGFSSLINARQFPEDESALEKMAQAAEMPSMEGSVRSGILFQLAAAWEKRGDYVKAFDFAQKANESSLNKLSYDAKQHRNRCARIRASFCKPLYEHRKKYGLDSTLPVFVLGMPRSGTTLVEQIISGHSDIFGAGELGLIPNIAQGLNRWERHVGSGRQYPDCIDDMTSEITAGVAENLLKELQEYAPDAKHVVDKLPHNFENVGLIKFLFPNAKIISVRRDPRDIAISNYFTDYQAKHGGMGFAYDLTSVGEQLADHNLLMRHWHETFPGEILELNYEDVVDDLEGSARVMLDYIGVDWQPEVLKFNELDRAVKTASVWQVRQPIYKTSKAKWKRYQAYLKPLIKGTNAKIEWEEFEMLTLPVPGFLQEGVSLYKDGDLDGAEINFKKMLHHNPAHAACRYMLGLVYMSKQHAKEGMAELAAALQTCPWQKEWKESLALAYEQEGETEKLAELEQKYKRRGDPDGSGSDADGEDELNWAGADKEFLAEIANTALSEPYNS